MPERSTLESGLPITFFRGPGTAAVIFAPPAFGVAPDLEAQMAELARGAKLVAAFDPFFRDGRGLVPYDDMPSVMERVRALDLEAVERDLHAAFSWSRGEGASSIVIVGICLGGPFALRAAAAGLVDAAVIWHGSRLHDHLGGSASTRCPIHFHFGSEDPLTPPSTVDAVRKAFPGPGVEIAVHAGATHGFTHRTARAYDRVAEAAAMDSVRALIG
jgi:dienelactone hydrolase